MAQSAGEYAESQGMNAYSYVVVLMWSSAVTEGEPNWQKWVRLQSTLDLPSHKCAEASISRSFSTEGGHVLNISVARTHPTALRGIIEGGKK